MSEPDPTPPSPTPPAGANSLDPNIQAFLAILAPPLSSIAAAHVWGSHPLVRHHAVQGTVFGIVVLLGLVAIGLFAPAPPPAGTTASDSMVLVALLIPLFNLCWALAWVGQMIAALGRKRWFVPLIAPITRRFLSDGNQSS
jgi:uncharacterized membrane protein